MGCSIRDTRWRACRSAAAALLKAVLAGRAAPYADDDLVAIARNCTEKEDAARKVEREMSKRIAIDFALATQL